LLLALLRHASDLVGVVDREGTIRYIVSQHVLGYPEDQLTGVFALDYIHPDDRAAAIDKLFFALNTPGTPVPFECRVRHADGSWRVLEVAGVNMLDDPVIEGLLFRGRDVTEQRRAEQLVAASERRWRQLVRSTADQVVVISADGRVTRVEGMHGLLGFPDDEVWDVDRAIERIHPDDRQRAIDAWTALMTTPGEHPPLMGRVRDIHGNWRWLESLPVNMMDDPDVGALVVTTRDITDRVTAEEGRLRAEARLAHQASHDPLTMLPNRTLLMDRLRQAIARVGRSERAVGVLLLDLDRFKVINDSLGHPAGDAILSAVADRLRIVIRPGDTVARLGGDEFVVVCEGLDGEDDAVRLAGRLGDAIGRPYSLGSTELTLTASIGIAITTDDQCDAALLLRDADAVMYRAKERGRNRWDVVDEELRARAVERLATETALRQALRMGAVRLHYQPIVSVTDGRPVGAEGLARWHDGERGVLAPAAFIGVAEDSGLIVPLGDGALRQGCERAAQLAQAGADLVVSVNVSAQQLAGGRLEHAVSDALSATGADPAHLALEITETAVMSDLDAVVPVLHSLRGMGVHLWVDDFGTGYSSFAYLRKLPLDGLKIDRSFIAGLAAAAEDRAIVAGIIGLAHSLGLAAVAEGVESLDQALVLRDLECDQAQGYMWARPMPAPDVDRWLLGRT
jgi:diguanylate cyclase (GGDEF)-like protein/PAS domain S-box-containing protein